MLELNQVSDEEKNYGQFSLRYKAEGRPSGFIPFHSIVHQIPGDQGGAFCISLPSRFHLSPSLLPLIPLCLSFELYPLNLQLWGAVGMRDTFSRKFARRILKPRGKQDQYLVSQEEGTRRSCLWYPAVLWLVAQSFCVLSFRSSFLLAVASRRRGRTTPYVVKDDEGISCSSAEVSYGSCVLRRDLLGFPFVCRGSTVA